MPLRTASTTPTPAGESFSWWWRLTTSSHRWPIALMFLAVVLGNGLYLIHFSNPNPINVTSGLGVIQHAGVFAGKSAVDPNNGITAQALGHLVATDWFSSHIPWWDPYEGMGAPLAGEMQAGAFFPPTLLLTLSNGQVYAHALVELIAGLSTYFLLLRLGIGRLVATAGAIAFALNGTFAWFAHAPANPVAFLPLLLLGIELAGEAAVERKHLGWCTIAIALALATYAGFPETAYIDGILAVIWVVARAILTGDARWRFLGKVAIGAVVGGLLAAPILVAFTDYLPNALVGAHNGTLGDAALIPPGLSQTVMPYVFGSINQFFSVDKTQALTVLWGNTGGFLTAGVGVLALIGLAGRSHRPLRIALALWTVMALGRTYGYPPLRDVINALPGMENVAFFRYSAPSWEMAVIVLAALGLDDVVRQRVSRVWLLGSALAAVGVIILADDGAQALLHQLRGATRVHLWADWSLVWALVIMISISLAALLFRGRFRTVLLCALVSVDAVAMFVVPQLSAPRSAHIDTGPVRYLERHLGDQRFYTLGPLEPNYGSYFKLASIDTNDLPVPKLWGDYITHRLDTDANPLTFEDTYRESPIGPSALLEFLTHLTAFEEVGVKYLVAPARFVLPPTPQGLRLPMVYSDKVAEIFALPFPRPMFSLPNGGCFIASKGISQVDLLCHHSHPVVRDELYMPGWTATDDGHSLPITKYHGVMQEVQVPNGANVVIFTFAPPHLMLATVGFVLGLLLVVPFPFYLRRRQRLLHHQAQLTDRAP